MRPRCAALLAVAALAGGLSGCGSDDELSTDIPRTSPDLTIPTQTTEVTPSDTTTSTSTSTTTTAGAEPQAGATPPAAANPPAAAAPQAPPPPVSTTGGAGAPANQSTTGGANAGDSEFQNFCRDNPGAPPPC